MKQLLLLLFTSGCFAVSSQTASQNQPVRIESNGVQVFEAIGNENTIITNEPLAVVSKTINDWNLVECQDALYYIDLKIQLLKESGVDLDQMAFYEQQKNLINERKQFLMSK